MVAGRKPKPNVVRILEGNRGKRPLRDEPKPDPVAPKPPSWLGKEARAEWRRIVPELEKLGLIGRVDRAALVAYCETWQTYVDSLREARAHGVLVVGDKGRTVKNPALQIMRDAAAGLRAWCEQFGMTPAGRGRMNLPQQSVGDDDDLFDA